MPLIKEPKAFKEECLFCKIAFTILLGNNEMKSDVAIIKIIYIPYTQPSRDIHQTTVITYVSFEHNELYHAVHTLVIINYI